MMKKIVILGAGFAALTAAKKLNQLLDCKRRQIILVAPQSKFTYLPSTIWLPYGLRSKQQLEFKLEKFLAKHQIEFIQGEVTTVCQTTITTSEQTINFDYLLIATGAKFITQVKGITENAIIPCAGITAVKAIRDKLVNLQSGAISFGFSTNLNEPSAMRGGPMFEFMFGIDTWLRQNKKRDKFTLNFISPAPKPGLRLGEKAVANLLKEMHQRNIKTYLGSKITEFGKDFISTKTDKFNSDLSLFIPGMTGSDWLKNTDLPLSAGGFIKSASDCSIEGFDNILVAGDIGSFPGPDWRPKQAHMADLQAIAASKNIVAKLNNKPANYIFKTELICIIDMLNTGILVFRNHKFNIVVKCKLLHLVKILFEKIYLTKFK